MALCPKEIRNGWCELALNTIKYQFLFWYLWAYCPFPGKALSSLSCCSEVIVKFTSSGKSSSHVFKYIYFTHPQT